MMPERTEHHWAVDAIEEGMARIEEDGRRTLTIPVHLLPSGVKEGQLLLVTRTTSAETKGKAVVLSICVDETATANAARDSKAMTAKMLAESKKRDRGGDVTL